MPLGRAEGPALPWSAGGELSLLRGEGELVLPRGGGGDDPVKPGGGHQLRGLLEGRAPTGALSGANEICRCREEVGGIPFYRQPPPPSAPDTGRAPGAGGAVVLIHGPAGVEQGRDPLAGIRTRCTRHARNARHPRQAPLPLRPAAATGPAPGASPQPPATTPTGTPAFLRRLQRLGASWDPECLWGDVGERDAVGQLP